MGHFRDEEDVAKGYEIIIILFLEIKATLVLQSSVLETKWGLKVRSRNWSSSMAL